MYLHIMPDNIYSEKFIGFIERFFPREEHFFVIRTKKTEPEYVSAVDTRQLYLLKIKNRADLLRSLNQKELKELFLTCRYVYLHSLGIENSLIAFRYARTENSMTWLSWGFDIYKDFNLRLLEDETREILPSQRKPKKFRIMHKINQRIKRIVISKLDRIAIDYYDEYLLIKSKYKTNASYQAFHYPSPIDFTALDRIKSGIIPQEISMIDRYNRLVQVGNSGSPNNNHLSIFNFLVGLEDKDFGIVCPLSYGNQTYIDKIIRIGNELFGERFIPMTEFLSPEVYRILLTKIDITVMNHYRQQGKGNIIPLIYMGKKVYLREGTTTYQDLIRKGIRVESIDVLMKEGSEKFFNPLSTLEVDNNRLAILNNYSDAEDLRKIKELFYD